MAWSYEQDFDALTDGDLNGQDSWSGATEFDVTTSGTPAEGAKHVASVLEADAEREIGRSVTGVTAGTVYVSVKISRTAGSRRGSIYLYQGVTLMGRIFVSFDGGSNNAIRILNNASFTDLDASISNDTYYRIGIDWDDVAQSDSYRANVNNGSFSSWGAWVNNAALSTGIDKIAFVDQGNNGSGTGTIYWDAVSPTYALDTSGSSTRRRMMTGIGA